MSVQDEVLTVYQREQEIIKQKLVAEEPVAFKDLVWENNIRSEAAMQLDKMVASFKAHGQYLPKYPIIVVKHGKKLLVLCGNRRTLALAKIKETEPVIFKEILPDGKIPALILDGLTPTEESLIRIDHASDEDRVGLDDESIYLAIKQLVDVGITGRRDLAAKLGLYIKDPTTGEMKPNGSYVQQRSNLARLPDYVQDEYIKMMRDRQASKVRWGQVPQLFKKFMAGFNSGKLDGGEAFKEYWNQCLNPVAKDSDDNKVKPLSKNELSKAAEKLGSTAGRLLCLRVAGNPVVNDEDEVMSIEDIDSKIIEAEAALATLTDIRNFLGPKKFDEMMAEIMKAKK